MPYAFAGKVKLFAGMSGHVRELWACGNNSSLFVLDSLVAGYSGMA
jgi:hypothetical protein